MRKTKLSWRLTAICLSMLGFSLAAPSSQAESLLQVFQEALANDPQYLGAGSANRASQELRPQARAQLLPNASLNASTDINHQKVRSSGGFGGAGTSRFSSSSFSLNVTQPIYRQDLLIGIDQANGQIRQANAQYAAALQDLMVRVSDAYFGVLAAEDDLEFLMAERDATDQQLKQSEQRFEVGLIAITDVEESKAGYDIANAQVIDAQNSLDNAWEALREITGQHYNELRQLSRDTPLITPEPARLEAWTNIALEQNLLLLAAREATDVARIEIKRNEAQHLPTLDLVASHGVDQTGGRFGDSDIVNSVIGFQVNVPIYQGGEILSQTREARHLHQQSLDDLERQRRSAQRQARDAFRGVTSGISQVRALEQAVVSTESAFEAIEAGFQVGTRTSVDVLNAQRDRFRSRRDLSQARYDYILDILRLKQAAGTLSEEDLAQINGWLE